MAGESASKTSIAVTGFLCGTVLASLVSYLITSRRGRRYDGKDDNCTESAPMASAAELPKEMREEQMSRTALYFGPEGMEEISKSRVCVVGLGGVGSHAAHMLARGGVRYLRLVDFDQVTLSSLNRHACATLQDVGIPKATCLVNFLRKICPDPNYLHLDPRVQMYTGEDASLLQLENSQESWNMVVDAIDDVPTKAKLLAYCIRNKIRVISCMGAGGKSDMTRLHISDLRSASRDPLASKLRQMLKKELKDFSPTTSYMDDMEQVAVIYSSEKTVVKLVDFTEQQIKEGVHHFGAVDGMRIRVLPVLGTMPAIMGQSCAAMALCEIGKQPFSPMAGERVGRNVRHRMLQHFKRREKVMRDDLESKEVVESNDVSEEGNGSSEAHVDVTKINPNEDKRAPRILENGTRWVGPTQIDGDDVEYLMTEVWRNRCAVTGDRLGTVLELTRWDLARPSTCNNVVLMGASSMQKLDAEGQSSFSFDVRKRIESRLLSARVDSNA